MNLCLILRMVSAYCAELDIEIVSFNLYLGKICRLVSKDCKFVGIGSAVPSLSVSNDDLAKIVDTSDEWISVRTGIRNRRIISGQNIL